MWRVQWFSQPKLTPINTTYLLYIVFFLGGGGIYLLPAIRSHLAIDHASFSKTSTGGVKYLIPSLEVATPENRSNHLTLFSIYMQDSKHKAPKSSSQVFIREDACPCPSRLNHRRSSGLETMANRAMITPLCDAVAIPTSIAAHGAIISASSLSLRYCENRKIETTSMTCVD